jgi:hypothetical protein
MNHDKTTGIAMATNNGTPLFTSDELTQNFTCPSKRTIQPENVEIGSIHISINPDDNGLHTIYDSGTNTSMKASRASIAAFTMAINDSEHHEALRIK